MLLSRFSLKSKLILVIWTVSLTVLIVGVSVVVYKGIQQNKQNLIHEVELSASLIGESSAAALSFEEYIGVREVLSKLQIIPYMLQGAIYKDDNTLFAYYNCGKTSAPPIVIDDKESIMLHDSVLVVKKNIIYYGKKLGNIRVVASTESLQENIRGYMLTMGILILSLMFLTYILANWFQRYISGPVLDLTRVTNEITVNANYSKRVRYISGDEIGGLYTSFNAMLDMIEHREKERNAARLALEQSESKYRSFIESSNDAIYLLYNRNFELVNQKFLEMFDLTSEQLYHSDFSITKLIAPESIDALIDREKKIQDGEKVDDRYEFIGITTKGKKINLEANVSYIPYKDGKATQGFLRDITEHRKLEEQLRQAQKMEAIGRLSGGMAHDFNNLLTIILGYCELAGAKLGNDHPTFKSIEQISKAGKRAESLTRQLLAFSRRQVIQPVIVDLNKIIIDLDKMLRRLIGENIELVTLLSDHIGNIKVDPGQLEQIIMNLAINARDAMPHGGKITIKTELEKLDKDFIRMHANADAGNYNKLTVSDNGIGMDKELLDQIFEPFFTTKEQGKGTGLGLSTVYGIVQQSNGIILVDSKPKKGTVFNIYFPVNNEKAESAKKRKLLEEQLSGTESILIVEDVDELRLLAADALKAKGFKVKSAANGDEAISLFDSHKNGFDLLLTDVIMPGINGRKLAEILQSKKPELEVLFMSGYTDDLMEGQGVLSEDIAFLQKPFTPTILVKKVRHVLDKNKSA